MYRPILLALAATALLAAGCGDDDANGSEDAALAAETAMKEKEDAAMKEDDKAPETPWPRSEAQPSRSSTPSSAA